MTQDTSIRLGGRMDIVKLVAAVLVSGLGVASGIAVGGILAQELAGTASAGGLAQTFVILGAGAAAIPLATIARRAGRRRALMTGYAIGAAGAITILIGGQSGNLLIVLLGMLLYGSNTAASLQARFAATEYTSSTRSGRAMSFVVWGSTIGSVVGPNLTNVADLFGESIGLRSLIGPYTFSLTAFLIAIAILSFLRPASIIVKETKGARNGPTLPEALKQTLRSRSATFGLFVVVGGQMMMSAVMVMTPVSMHNTGFDLQAIGFVLSCHILGMYALSPVVGWLADRWRPVRVGWLGMGFFSVAISLGVFDALWHTSTTLVLTIALFFLGLGWCCTLIGGSTLLTQSLPKQTRVAVQGSSDAMMNLGAASLAALSGPALQFGGFFAVNMLSTAVLLLALVPLGLRAISAAGRQERIDIAAKEAQLGEAEPTAEETAETMDTPVDATSATASDSLGPSR